tara:strand:- start:51 stop:431 length:381 start_codon:yes stop_codon:yes gene_type:complete
MNKRLKNERGELFSISLGDCFRQDTVSLSINDLLVLDKVVLNSDFSTGLANMGVYYDSKSNELVKIVKGLQQRIPFAASESLKLSVIKNSKEYSFHFQLSKGRNILIEGCESKIKANQFKKQMTFE